MLLKNDLLHYSAPRERTVRVLWIDSAASIAYVFELNARNAQPELMTMPALLADVQSQRASVLLADPYAARPAPPGMPERHLQKRARALEIVTELTSHEPAIYQASARGRMVLEYSTTHSISHPSVYRYLRRFWERGQNADALLPDYKNSGAPGKTRGSSAGVKRGRPRKAGSPPGLNADAGIRRTFKVAVARYAATHAQFSRRGAYRQMIEDFFAARGEDALPSFGQFNYWIEKDGATAHP